MSQLLEQMSAQQMRARGAVMLSFEGTIVADTYNPADSTVQVAIGEAFANFDDPNQQPYAVLGKLFTTHIGIKTPPLGGERAVVILTRGIPRVMLNVDEDDSGAAPAMPGEFYFMHVKPGTTGAGNTPVTDSGITVEQDGATEGDGLGSVHVGQQGAYTTADTASGHQVALNDTAKTVTVTSADGHQVSLDDQDETLSIESAAGHSMVMDDNAGASAITVKTATAKLQAIFDDVAQTIKTAAQSGALYMLLDGNGNAISHVAPAIALGAVAGTGSLIPAITKTDISNMINDSAAGILIQRYQDMRNVLAALTTLAGGISGFPTLGALNTELFVTLMGLSAVPTLPGFAKPLLPNGSSVVTMLP